MQSPKKSLTEAQRATAELMSHPDWKIRWAIAKKEMKEPKGISLEQFLRERLKGTPRKKAA
jgi:hypothetical protein